MLYVNDSKATNVSAAATALRSFEGGVHAILGGSLKGESFEPLAAPVAERCRAAYLIGEAAEALEEALEPAAAAGVQLQRCEDLEDAVRRASAAAERPARSSCSPRPAPASTPSATSRSAGSASARSSRLWRERPGPGRLALEAQAIEAGAPPTARLRTASASMPM